LIAVNLVSPIEEGCGCVIFASDQSDWRYLLFVKSAVHQSPLHTPPGILGHEVLARAVSSPQFRMAMRELPVEHLITSSAQWLFSIGCVNVNGRKMNVIQLKCHMDKPSCNESLESRKVSASNIKTLSSVANARSQRKSSYLALKVFEHTTNE
jgi:hypothetical protein